MLSFDHVSRWHETVIGLNDVTVALRPGITAILGPNGSGKSTFLRLAVGLLRPHAGTVRVLDENPWDNPRLMRRIGYVPDGPVPWPERSGLACVERVATLADLPDATAAAAKAMDDLGLGEAQDRPSGTYSHGMAQRLKLAMAAVHDPELLILDEPVVGTDPLARRDILQRLQALARSGKTVVLATHVLADVDQLGGDLLLLDHGRLVAHGAQGEIRDLLDQVPRTIRIGSPNPRVLGAQLWELESVLSVESQDGAVVVRTRQPAVFYAQLQQLAAEGNVTSITSPDDSVESIFRHVVEAQ